MTRVSALDQTLRAAGIPIHGVSSGPPVRIDFRDEATAAHREQAAQIEASFVYTPRKPRKPDKIIADLDALSSAAWRRTVNRVLAELLQSRPDLLKPEGIEGDEP